MVAAVLLSLACGIALTIGAVALIAIAARRFAGPPIFRRISNMERGARVLQAVAGVLIAAIAAYSIWSSVYR
jgi:ABC-type nickel/cobalt efflux system permease component RcnA